MSLQFFMQQVQDFILQNQWIICVIIAWTLPWKGIALWKAAKGSQKIWFIMIFLLNTFAILDIIYIVFFSKDKKEEEKIENTAMIPRNGNRIV